MRDTLILLAILGTCFGIGVWLMMGGAGAKVVIQTVQDWVMKGHALRTFYVLVGILVLGLVFFVVRQRMGSGSAWEEFALTHGFRHVDRSPTRPLGRVLGEVGGMPLELAVETRSDLHNREYRSYVRMTLRLPAVPAGLGIMRRIQSPAFVQNLTEKVRPAMGIPDAIQTEDVEFDRAFTVRGENPEAVRAWLTEDRRRAVREFMAEDGFLITGGTVAWTHARSPTTAEPLDAALQRLSDAARNLDSAIDR